ncbi:MAG: serine acetyltransferase [Clostridia bacterium]|nr:serine acetyltransferase [Clostridia bacterium]
MTEATKKIISKTVDEISANYKESDILMLKDESALPDRGAVIEIIKGFRSVMFPGYFEGKISAGAEPEYYIGSCLTDLYERLLEQVTLALSYKKKGAASVFRAKAEKICDSFFEKLPEVQKMLLKDVEAGYNGDPAAKSREEIICSYPGFLAIFVYRIAHELYVRKVPFIPRIMTEYAHGQTGIDINSGAEIGEYFFIDHGTGVVVGETTVIGDNVKLYQGVTLGALSLKSGQKLAGKKRHPSVEDGVTIYANATILGGETKIGERSVVGGNTFITESVDRNVKVSAKTPELNIKTKNNK